MGQTASAGAGDSATVVIFGASGDLTARKIVPALFSLWAGGHLPRGISIVGVARREKSDASFRDEMYDACSRHARVTPAPRAQFDAFVATMHYHVLDFDDEAGYDGLRARLEGIESGEARSGDRVFYLSTLPEQFAPIVERLGRHGLVHPPLAASGSPPTLAGPQRPGWSRVVIEKPFGNDLESARQLNRRLTAVLSESQIYRIDHYLGKETVQNILSFRFGNAVFEPLFNNHYVDHVQITAAETQGIEAARGAYYDKAGAMRDMIQNHVMQLLCLVAMEPPAIMGGEAVRDEKLKVLRALAPRLVDERLDTWAIRGQYGPNVVAGQTLKGYREEERIAPASNTPTYVALRVEVDNWRWAGTPFFLRSGKRLPKQVTEIAVIFKRPPLSLFQTVECVGDVCDVTDAKPNALIFRIQPDEEISLSLSIKRPGLGIVLQPVEMDFEYGKDLAAPLPEAYERLLLDVLRGDSTLFMRADQIECAWEFITPILQAWDAAPPQDFPNYPAGTWGPVAAQCLFRQPWERWREP